MNEVYKNHRDSMLEIIKDLDDKTKKLIDGMIDQSSRLYEDIYLIQEKIKITGHVIFNKKDPIMQKELPASKTLTRLQNQYNSTISSIYKIISKQLSEESDDDLDEFMNNFHKEE